MARHPRLVIGLIFLTCIHTVVVIIVFSFRHTQAYSPPMETKSNPNLLSAAKVEMLERTREDAK